MLDALESNDMQRPLTEEPERLLHIEKIVKKFHNQAVLKDVDFDLYPGEIVAICGTNGAGKSTLSNIIMGIYQKDGGQIFVDGKEVEFNSPKDAEAKGIGMVHQEPTLAKNMTVYENIFLNNEIVKAGILNKKKMIAESNRILNFIGFNNINAKEKVANLTLVQREVVEIAKSILLNPKILILDEVTAPLNLKETEHLFQIIRDLKTRGMGIVFIGHKIKEITQIADRIVVIRDGCIVGNLDNKNKTIDEKAIIRLMLNEKEGWQHEYSDKAREDASNEVLLSLNHYSSGNTFDDVNIELHKGEIIGLAGVKGSGITELMLAIYGAYPHSSGEIIKGGRPIEPMNPKQAINCEIGMITNDRQTENVAMTLPVLSNMIVSSLDKFSNKFRLVNAKREKAACKREINNLDIKTTGGQQLVQFLSGGNQQKVVIAKWMIRDMDVLLCDEPTRGVDVKAKNDIYELLISQKASGRGVLIYSPEIRELLNVSDRILIFAHGKVVASVNRSDSKFTESGVLELVHTSH